MVERKPEHEKPTITQEDDQALLVGSEDGKSNDDDDRVDKAEIDDDFPVEIRSQKSAQIDRNEESKVTLGSIGDQPRFRTSRSVAYDEPKTGALTAVHRANPNTLISEDFAPQKSKDFLL